MLNRFKKLGWVASLVVLLVGVMECTDFTSPEGLFKITVSSLKAEKVKTFRKTLRSEALEQYGTLAGMGALRKELELLDLKIGPVTKVREDHDTHGEPQFRGFELEVLSREKGTRGPVSWHREEAQRCYITNVHNSAESE
jgi:hypothetical protein